MPIDVADEIKVSEIRSLNQVGTIPMEEPWPRVVGHKPDGDVVSGKTNVDRITLNRIDIVVLC